MKLVIDFGQLDSVDEDQLIEMVSRALHGEHDLESGESVDLGRHIVSIFESDSQHVPRRSFATWLTRQTHRDDPIGDLARDIAKDNAAPNGRASKGQWIAHLRMRGQHVIVTFKEAWQEFSGEK